MSELHRWTQLLRLMSGTWVARAIHAATELRIADSLAEGPRTAEALAATAGVSPRPLNRLLRALAAVGVFGREPDGRFRLNPLAEMLREDGSESFRSMVVMLGGEQERCWDDLLETIRTGEPAFERLYGEPIFSYMAKHPDKARVFDAAMSAVSSREVQEVLEAYDLSGVRRLADVGGGAGATLACILGRYPEMRGVLFDLPHVAEQSRTILEHAGVTPRCVVQGGDFFETAPGGADVYLLRRILHDWDDAKAGLILKNLRRVMSPGTRLLVVDVVLADDDGQALGKLIDLHMMVVAGGTERTEAEFRRLLTGGGFRMTGVIPTSGEVSVIESVAA